MPTLTYRGASYTLRRSPNMEDLQDRARDVLDMVSYRTDVSDLYQAFSSRSTRPGAFDFIVGNVTHDYRRTPDHNPETDPETQGVTLLTAAGNAPSALLPVLGSLVHTGLNGEWQAGVLRNPYGTRRGFVGIYLPATANSYEETVKWEFIERVRRLYLDHVDLAGTSGSIYLSPAYALRSNLSRPWHLPSREPVSRADSDTYPDPWTARGRSRGFFDHPMDLEDPDLSLEEALSAQ